MWVNRDHNPVLGPIPCPSDLLRTHIFERKHLAVSILTEPQTGVTGDILELQIAAKFYSLSREIKWKTFRKNRKIAGRVQIALEAPRPLTVVGSTIVRCNRPRRICVPTGQIRTLLIFESQRLLEV